MPPPATQHSANGRGDRLLTRWHPACLAIEREQKKNSLADVTMLDPPKSIALRRTPLPPSGHDGEGSLFISGTPFGGLDDGILCRPPEPRAACPNLRALA
jgi:hypothetical protein